VVNLGKKELGILALILIGIFSLIFFGFTGFKVVIGFIALFFLPFYLILDNFDLEEGEKIIFSLFIGVVMFPSLVYLLGGIFGIRISIIVSFVVFVLGGLMIRWFFSRANKNTSDDND